MPRYNPERQTYRGRSYKKGGVRIDRLREVCMTEDLLPEDTGSFAKLLELVSGNEEEGGHGR